MVLLRAENTQRELLSLSTIHDGAPKMPAYPAPLQPTVSSLMVCTISEENLRPRLLCFPRSRTFLSRCRSCRWSHRAAGRSRPELSRCRSWHCSRGCQAWLRPDRISQPAPLMRYGNRKLSRARRLPVRTHICPKFPAPAARSRHVLFNEYGTIHVLFRFHVKLGGRYCGKATRAAM